MGVCLLFPLMRSFQELHVHRITEWLKLKGTSGGHLVQPLCPSKTTKSKLSMIVCRWLLIISKDGDTTISLGNLCRCSVTLTVKMSFLMFRCDLLCFSLCPVSPVQSQGTTEESLAPFFLHL